MTIDVEWSDGALYGYAGICFSSGLSVDIFFGLFRVVR